MPLNRPWISSSKAKQFRGVLGWDGLLPLIAAMISDYYARDVLAAFKMFVRWLAGSTDKLEALPKNIDDKSLAISIANRKVQPLTRNETRR